MIKTIKVKKKLRLDGLIQKVWDGQLPSKIYVSDKGLKEISVMENGIDCNHIDNGIITSGDTFTLEVEEEITEDTVFDSLIETTADGGYIDHGYNVRVSDVKGQHSVRFYTPMNKKLEPIWEAE